MLVIKQLQITTLKKRHFYNSFIFLFVVLLFSTTSYESSSNAEALEEIDPYCGGLDFYNFDNIFNTPPKNIKVLIPQSKNYYENLVNASFTGNYINEKFKNQLNGYVEVQYEEVSCKFKARIRISGDWKDHINLDDYISSLDVRLVEGNIQGITKFKLFLPRTRNYDNEIFVATALKEFGILSPRTFYVNLNFNDYFEGNFIFQEKIVKELVEYNNLRESLILESDERYVWENSDDPYFRNMDETSKKNMFISAKYLNQLWVSKNESNYEIYKSAAGLFNRAIFSSNKVKFNLKSESFDNFEMSKFETLGYALKFRHGLVAHNRKFYFDRLSDQFIPIYYDGLSTFLDNPEIESLDETFLTPEIIYTAKILKAKEINLEKLKKNLSLNGLEYSDEELKKLIDVLFSNLNYISIQEIKNEGDRVNIRNNFLTTEQEKKAIFSYKGMLKHCSKTTFIQCKDFSNDHPSLLNSIIEKNSVYFGDYESFFSGKLNKLIETNINGVFLYSVEEPNYEFIEEDNILKLKINNINQRYKLVISEKTSPTIINLEILDSIKPYYSNNEFLLTGCLTIYNSKFKNLTIKIENSFCEDALNIIDSSGHIELIEIKNSDFDAVDIDYSNIRINQINVKSSDNDCVDLSKGTYSIDKIEASDCLDKGVSIGENSKVNIRSAMLTNTKTALAIKDFSIVEVENFTTINSEFCLKVYQKKQEFGPSKLSLGKLVCDSNYFIQKGSILEK